ncbi:XisH family protein [Laspinema olomoucense]|uniref:XisH family protein n=1 Tax=Laspinema olomoucense D3b TaxID=2953688 RepID=A0ABT2N6G3_9CYAN|nr:MULTISPECIES: XisH family protein [unclassified Laspinema]MCT7972152.1 XisH family protein [Laspinema sp. D3d]MCT7978289.1 XisH family protein [Laspinema sp. D3b]
MPTRDTIHNSVKKALIKEGWQITDDPYIISYGERFLFVDLAATESSINDAVAGQFIGAEQKNKRIAIEIKAFRNPSAIADLEQAIGQYILYRLLLQEVDPDRLIYLAIPEITYLDIFREPIGDLVISKLSIKLIIVDIQEAEVKQWIPARPIETL